MHIYILYTDCAPYNVEINTTHLINNDTQFDIYWDITCDVDSYTIYYIDRGGICIEKPLMDGNATFYMIIDGLKEIQIGAHSNSMIDCSRGK